MTSQLQWRSDWTADEPAEIGFAWAPSDGRDYVPAADGFAARDVGVNDASRGAIGVRRCRVSDVGVATAWRVLDLDFDFHYVLVGQAAIEDADGTITQLEVGSTAWHARGHRYRIVDPSTDFEVLHVTAPAWVPSVDDSQPDSPVDLHCAPIYTHDRPEEYVRGDGPRSFFSYRDLRTREVTGGRMHIHIVRASEPGPATGWHYHSMAQWFLVVSGTGVIRYEDHPRYPLSWGASMCVGRGPDMRHNVSKYSGDYAVIEICIPADYETIPVDEPEGADSD